MSLAITTDKEVDMLFDQAIEQMREALHLPYWAWDMLVLLLAVLLGILLKIFISWILRRTANREAPFSFYLTAIRYLGRPFAYFLPLLLVRLSLPFLYMPHDYRYPVGKVLQIGIIIVVAWIIINGFRVVEAYVGYKFDVHAADNFKARKIHTQLQFLHRVFSVVIILLAIAAILLSFKSVRNIGTGLLAGVGVSSIIIGFAAQNMLSNLFAGLQIAFAQPMRIDDIVVVEGEWGTIEEITLTYVVVKIWDLRRLVLPITYFTQKPFQNWSRTSTDLIGTVFIYADYTLPVEAIRSELDRLLEHHPLWDGKVKSVQVTDTTEHTMQIRILVSASDSSKTFDLRCDIREKIIRFLQEQYPQCLPRARAELYPLPASDKPAEKLTP
ncbi:small-conductance mechanosensitive channel [Thermoflavifilum aggregans]|uniref:Small-conductance mechanosensitive channel n=1 Tax=Thermoflavifilum aggregans TaxID=454188 RepID=A0A2M9CUY4_9BACT|nr:mechanosensitive ion channel domain-containing protein [Thermoflavifilum aggregans]PJJ75699.1 small-conductance mechanosensitive channel [Thermoflavifilum aggregans]